MTSTRKKSSWRWRLLALATVGFFIVAGIYFVIIPIQQSKRLEQALIDRFDWANEYTPPMDGLLRPERVEAFIQVREAVQSNCIIFQRLLDDIISLEAIEEDPEMSAHEKTARGLDGFKSMFSAAPMFLEFMDARNSALLEQEMGLGEYFYIYLAAYGPQLARESDSPNADMEEAFISQRSREEFIQILENQLAALASAMRETRHEVLIADLRSQIKALKNGSQSSPWPNGPVGMLRESLSPFGERLGDLYCSGIVKTELLQKNRGLNFKG